MYFQTRPLTNFSLHLKGIHSATKTMPIAMASFPGRLLCVLRSLPSLTLLHQASNQAPYFQSYFHLPNLFSIVQAKCYPEMQV